MQKCLIKCDTYFFFFFFLLNKFDTHLDCATELNIALDRDRMIHRISAFQLQEEQSRILRLLHIEHVLYVEIVPRKNTLSRVLEARLERETRDSGMIRERAQFIV